MDEQNNNTNTDQNFPSQTNQVQASDAVGNPVPSIAQTIASTTELTESVEQVESNEPTAETPIVESTVSDIPNEELPLQPADNLIESPVATIDTTTEIAGDSIEALKDTLGNISPNISSAPSVSSPEAYLESTVAPAVPLPNLDLGKISYADAKVSEVPIESIVPNPYQPRKSFDSVQLQELADSIAEHGVIQPLVVNQTDTGYEIVVGERRFRASQMAGLKMVPVIVKSGMQDQTKLEVALIENIQRQELNPIEEAMAYDKLMKMFGMTQEQVAKKVGKSRPAIANTVRLLNLPAEIQRALIENKISEGHARAILGLSGTERQLALYKMITEQGMNVRQVESKVRELMSRPRLEAAGPADPHTMAMESELRSKLGTQVKIEKRGSGGKITIEFFSDQELNELVGKLDGSQEKTGQFFTV
jgi:ParB family chromosome partitioning protein